MPQSNELRVFISSTFRDLQEEREHLIKKIFPEVRSLCRERGITFTEIDLRWGLSDEQLALGQVIRTCLDEVDKCRPYFIGITGNRYGFVPSYLDIQKDPVLLESFPWIADAAIDGMSITEMEAHYLMLGAGQNGIDKAATEKARFYFRRQRANLDDSVADNEKQPSLEAYQKRIRESGGVIESFRDPASLGEQIYDYLIEIIKQDFADARPPTPLESERSRHASFSLSRRRAYIANPLYLKRLNDHASAATPPLVVYAESGSGKSSLLAYWAEQYSRRHPDVQIIEHYAGIGATATAHYGIIRHICMEVKERFGREEEIPSEPEKLDLALGQWLGYADHELRKQSPHSSLIIILDGLNHLQGDALSLHWIPDAIYPTIRLVISSTVDGTLVEARRRGWEEFGIQALSEAERETMVVRYLAEYHKSLNADQTRRISTDYKCGHPLFLKTVLEELRVVGRHEDLDEHIERYLGVTGTEDLFQLVLERLEEDYNLRTVRDVMTLLWASRTGLDERELSELSGLGRLKITTMIASLDYHLVRKESRLTYFHDYLRRAVEKRYLVNRSRLDQTRRILSEYFDSQELDVRVGLELIYQYRALGDTTSLVKVLSRPDITVLLRMGEHQWELLKTWSDLIKGGENVETAYRVSVGAWRVGKSSADLSKVLVGVGGLLESLCVWNMAEELYKELLSLGESEGETELEMKGHGSVGRIHRIRGEYNSAMEHLERSYSLAEGLGDHSEMARAIGSIGSVHADQGRYAEALESHGRYLAMSEELGDRSGMGRAIGKMGLVHYTQGRYAEALESHVRYLAMSEELGDRSGMARAIGNMGLVHDAQGRYAEALECYSRCLAMSEELGDRSAMAMAIGNMGNVYWAQGRYVEALERYSRQLAMSEELNDRRGMTIAIGNMGGVHLVQGGYSEALECYSRHLAISEELGDRHGMAIAIGNMGDVHEAQGRYVEALECYSRHLAMSEELGDRSGMAIAIGNMGNVYSDQGRYTEALECYQRALDEHRVIGYRYGVTCWLYGIAEVLLELAITGGAEPPYLCEMLKKEPDEQWTHAALRTALSHAEECRTISQDISQEDTLVSSSILIALIEAAYGRIDVAQERLLELLAASTEATQQAELHYWLWKICKGADQRTSNEPEVKDTASLPGSSLSHDAVLLTSHRTEALALYEQIFAVTPKNDYRKRIDELTAGMIDSAVQERNL